jgi:hypothetical protein
MGPVLILQDERGVSFASSGLFLEVHINHPGAVGYSRLAKHPKLARTGNEGLSDALTIL